MTEKEEKENVCDLCGAEPATVLCPECLGCYCTDCSKFIHKECPMKDHKTELIPEGVTVKATCHRHEKNVLEMFCIDEKELCCSECILDNFHEGHKVVKIEKIAQDNEIFSAAEVRKDFEYIQKSAEALDKKIAGAIEGTNSEERRAKTEIEKTFEEAHKEQKLRVDRLLDGLEQEIEKVNEKWSEAMEELGTAPNASDKKARINGEFERDIERLYEKKNNVMEDFVTAQKKLKEEEDRLIGELVKTFNEATDTLGNNLSALRELREYGRVLSDIGKTDGKCSRLLELNIVGEMKDASKRFEKMFNARMEVMEVKWHGGTKRLLFMKHSFNVVPSIKNVTVKAVSWNGLSVSWGTMYECRDAKYIVGTREVGKKDWKNEKSGSFNKNCTINGLKANTLYEVRVMCVKGNSMGEWSDVAKGKTVKITVPPNVTVKSTTCDSITLAWNKLDGASFYQVEVNGSKPMYTSSTNSFTERGLLPDTEYSFRVWAEQSEWSGVVKGRTLKAPKFSECVWKEYHGYAGDNIKYSLDKRNPRIATKNDDDYCKAVGNIPIPLNARTSWNIKILKSKGDDGCDIFIGVAPSDIKQRGFNYNDCYGWYFGCYKSMLRSGPPHDYKGMEYGPRKFNGRYVHTGDSVSIVMDTRKGEVSFSLNGMSLGIAYKGIPLDKPLVPCVIFKHTGDSIELVI